MADDSLHHLSKNLSASVCRAYSAYSSFGNIDDLAAECLAPQLKRKTFETLGTPTLQARELELYKVRIVRTPEQIMNVAQKRRRDELEALAEIYIVTDRQPYPNGQGTPSQSTKIPEQTTTL